MVFSSLPFIFLFLPITLLIYYALPMRFRNLSLLVTSIVFYGWGEPFYVLLMLVTIAGDYLFGLLIGRARARGEKGKGILVLSVIFNLAILAFFKYYGFVAENLAAIGLDFLPEINLKLPIGISFYTFQALSYVIDVYRGNANVQKNAVNFGAYVTMFPQLVAGPIVRYHDVDLQLSHREHTVRRFSSGISRFAAGLAKKVLIADTVCTVWEAVRDTAPDERTVLLSWFGIICYTFQIYFDFSGYSDMAIGLGRMIGFEFCENFNYPYISQSITDFWRRWHISLSSWFREYVYIPLGGNRCGTFNTYRNIFVVWLLTGIWHGANWNFVIWGLYYCALLIIEKAFLGRLLEKLPSAVKRIYSLVFIVFGWFIFASDTIASPLSYLGNMFGAGGTPFASGLTQYEILRNLPLLVICVIAATPLPKRLWERFIGTRFGRAASLPLTMAAVLLSVAYMVNSSYSPFLYFNF